MQLVSVLLVIAYLEEGAKNTLPGGKRPDPLRCGTAFQHLTTALILIQSAETCDLVFKRGEKYCCPA